MYHPLRSDEQIVLNLLCESGDEGQVVCHEPSKLQPEGNLVLITQEEAWQHLESEQDITFLFPPKGLVMALCARLTSDEKTIRVVMETINYISMKTDPLVYIFELQYHVQPTFKVHWSQNILWDDAILPTSLLQDNTVISSLKLQHCVRQVVLGEKNGCTPIHDSLDVTSLGIGYHSASVNPEEVRKIITSTFRRITDDHVQEAQFHGFPPWRNEAFKNEHSDSLDRSIIDISGFDDTHRTMLCEMLTSL